jgi:hypothetical protein
MAERGVLAGPEKRGNEVRGSGERNVADCIDAWMQTMEPAIRDVTGDPGRTEAKL